MAWTTPMTAVFKAAWTAAQWNTHVRDNLNETMIAKATTAGRWFVATGANAIAEREIDSATLATSQTSTSTSYVDLTTTVSVSLVTSTQALVFIAASQSNNGANNATYLSYAVSSATTIAASDTWAVLHDGAPANDQTRYSSVHHVTNLTAGTNVFTMKHRVAAGTGAWANREICVMGL